MTVSPLTRIIRDSQIAMGRVSRSAARTAMAVRGPVRKRGTMRSPPLRRLSTDKGAVPEPASCRSWPLAGPWRDFRTRLRYAVGGLPAREFGLRDLDVPEDVIRAANVTLKGMARHEHRPSSAPSASARDARGPETMSRLSANALLLLTAAIWGGGFVAQSNAMASLGSFWFTGLRFASRLPRRAAVRPAREPACRAAAHRRDIGQMVVLGVTFYLGTVIPAIRDLARHGDPCRLPDRALRAVRAAPRTRDLSPDAASGDLAGAAIAVAGTWFLGGGLDSLTASDLLTIVSRTVLRGADHPHGPHRPAHRAAGRGGADPVGGGGGARLRLRPSVGAARRLRTAVRGAELLYAGALSAASPSRSRPSASNIPARPTPR